MIMFFQLMGGSLGVAIGQVDFPSAHPVMIAWLTLSRTSFQIG